MSKELDKKWRELLAAHRTWWSPGMLVRDGDRYTEESRYPRSVRVPDWDDPATLGCLLGQVREAHDDWSINPVCVSDLDGTWMVLRPDDAAPDGERLIGCGPTEAGALLVALEVAP